MRLLSNRRSRSKPFNMPTVKKRPSSAGDAGPSRPAGGDEDDGMVIDDERADGGDDEMEDGGDDEREDGGDEEEEEAGSSDDESGEEEADEEREEEAGSEEGQEEEAGSEEGQEEEVGEAEAGGDEDEEEESGREEDDEDGTDDSDDDPNYNPSDDSGEYDDESDVEEEGEVQRRAPNVLEANSDDDPDPPPEDSADEEDFAPDENGWTRSYTKVKKRAFLGPTPRGPTFNPDAMRPVDYFFKFFSLSLFRRITRWTNTTMAGARRRTGTSIEEIRAWFGIVLVMGLANTNNMKNYWSQRPGFRNPLIANTMSKGRFQRISKDLTTSKSSRNPDQWPKETHEERQHAYLHAKKHPMYPVQPLWDSVKEACYQRFNAYREIAIDEAMIRYKGFKSAAKRVFMPFKPIRSGFKVYAVCESASGYMMNFCLHTVKQNQTMIDITLEALQPYLNLRHHVFCDRLYTSIAVAKSLLSYKTYLTGSIRKDSRDLPHELSYKQVKNPDKYLSIKHMKKTRRGTFYTRQQGRNLTFALWHDSSITSILSTAHNAWRKKPDDPQCPETGDHVRRYCSMDRVERKRRQPVPAPKQAVDYSKFMGGVDRADQFRSYGTTSRKSNTWGRQLLYFLIDVATVNAYICFKIVHAVRFPRKKVMERDHFIMDVAEGLIQGYSKTTDRARRARTVQARGIGVPKINGPGHILVRMPYKYGKVCAECSLQNNTRRPPGPRAQSQQVKKVTSRYGCPHCQVHLCKTSRSNCFARCV